MLINTQIDSLLQGEITSNEVIDTIFNFLEKELLDQNEIILNFQNVSFISVYFLERLEQFIQKSKAAQVINIPPSIYKVFQVAKSKAILEVCL